MVTMKEAALKALTNLQGLEQRTTVDLTRPIRMLERALLHLPIKRMESLVIAREAYDAISNCAQEAERIEDFDLKRNLRRIASPGWGVLNSIRRMIA